MTEHRIPTLTDDLKVYPSGDTITLRPAHSDCGHELTPDQARELAAALVAAAEGTSVDTLSQIIHVEDLLLRTRELMHDDNVEWDKDGYRGIMDSIKALEEVRDRLLLNPRSATNHPSGD